MIQELRLQENREPRLQENRGILDYVHTDVWGPTTTASIGGNHYFVSFIDDFSRRCWVYTMRHKGEVLEPVSYTHLTLPTKRIV